MLDGLRGIAILLVFLNHVDSKPILSLFPPFLKPIIETFFSSGVIGVSFLFILSGFLMAYIYPEAKSISSFLQKRYTRIFPLFLTMTLVMMVFRLKPDLNIMQRIVTILSFASLTHFFWVYIIKRLNNPKISRIIFFGFISLQVIMVFWYALGIMRRPPIFFNQQIPVILREGTITLVNATLTLPFGNYISMLDGVYWSLVSEVLFYIIYPIVCVPFIKVLARFSRTVKVLFFFSLIPFFSALTQISKHILQFSMLFFPLFMYFSLGILLGYLLKNKKQTIFKYFSKFDFLLCPAMFFIMLILMRLSLFYTGGMVNEYIRMLWTLPLFVLMIGILNEQTSISNFFSSKHLTFLGMISYSVYLSHTAIVDGLHLVFKPIDLQSNILFIILSFVLIVAIASCLYYLLERPYFKKRLTVNEDIESGFEMNFNYLSIGIILTTLLVVFIAYQSNYNFFSYEKSFKIDEVFWPRYEEHADFEQISIQWAPKTYIRFKSPEDRLGLVVASLSHISPPGNTGPPPELVFQIKEIGAKTWYSTSTYSLAEIGESQRHPFGFPVIENSKGKEFDIRLYLTNVKSREHINLNLKDGVLITSVSQLDKKEFIKNPFKLLGLLLNRTINIIKDFEARFVFLSLLPFMILTIYMVKRNVIS